MATETKDKKAEDSKESGPKLKQVEIIKFHPLIAHEVEDKPFLTEEKAKELIEKKYAKEVK